MANSAQARKRARQSLTRRQRNISLKSKLRTHVKNVVKAKSWYSIKSNNGFTYSRNKDVIDLQELKKCNFNYITKKGD